MGSSKRSFQPHCHRLPKANQILKNLLVAVVDEQVGGAGGSTGDGAGEGRVGNGGAEAGGGGAVAEEVGSETSNVGGGHGGTVIGVGAAAGDGGLDVNTGGEDVDEGSVVGEAGEAIAGVGGTDGAGLGGRGRGEGGGIGGRVTGSDGEEEAGVGDGVSGIVDGLGEATAERHVHDNTVGAALAGSVGDDELHTGNDTSAEKMVSIEILRRAEGCKGESLLGARAIVSEDLDGEEGGGLSNTIGGTTDSAGNVSAVSLDIIIVGVGEVGSEASTSTELGVAGRDTSVEDVGAGALTSGVIVGVGGASGGGAGDTGKTPRSVLLSGLDGDNGILLNEVDGRVVAEALELGLGQGGGEAREALGVGVVGIGGDGGDGRRDGGGDGVLLEADNVVVLDELSSAGDDDGGGRVALDSGRGGHGHGDEGEEGRGVHLDGCLFVWETK